MTIPDDSLRQSLQELDVPAEFNSYDATEDAEVVVRLETWRQRAYVVLEDVRQRLRERENLAPQEQVEVVYKVAQFDGEGAWTVDTTRLLAQEILEPYANGGMRLIEDVLKDRIKPVFKQNAHPKVNLSTGRVLSGATGGELAYQDYYEGQIWKQHPGIANVVEWCIRHLNSAMYERVWHLIIPPVMTLLDDYEIKFKLRGVQIISHLLGNAPPELLRRTGIDALLFSSFKTCLTFLRAPETPSLIHAVILNTLTLIERTTSPGSAERCEQLWSLLGEGIIESVWLYGYEESETVQTTLDVLPNVVKALGVGSARYLKVLVQQLVHPLNPAPENPATPSFRLSSVRALMVVMEECAPRISKWKGTILDGVCRCWVNLVESGAHDADARNLQMALQDTCSLLARVCPSVTKEEFPRLLEMDDQIFRALVAPHSRDDR